MRLPKHLFDDKIMENARQKRNINGVTHLILQNTKIILEMNIVLILLQEIYTPL